MQNFKRIALLASVCLCASAQAQITQIQGSDPISTSRTAINNNFTYLNGKQVTGSGAPSAGTCSSGTVGLLYTDTNPGGLFYVCMHTGTGYAWVTPNNPNAVLTTNVYANPPWIQSLDWSKLINIPPFPNSQLQLSGTNVPQRGNTNLVPSTGVTITSSDNPSTNTTTLTFSASGAGGSNGTVNNAPSGSVAVYQSSGNAVSGVAVSGDLTINATTGAANVAKTGGVAFAPSATTDTTNPSNIPYTSPANGATASNVKNIANSFLTPDSFGCHMVADSATDNSCLAGAINAALAAGNDIRIPASNNTTSGTYHYYAVRSPISINLRSHLSTDVNQGLTIQCEGAGTTIAYTGTDATQGLFKFIGSSGGGLDNVTIKNCTLASAANAQYVVQFAGVSGPRMNDVNIRVASGSTVQYGVQYLGSQQGSILGGANTNAQTGVYLGTLFSTQSGTQSTTTSASVASTDPTISVAGCGLLSGNWGSNVLIIDSEHIRASACSAGAVTVASTCGQQGTALCRGVEGTQAASHISGALVTTGSTITSNQITIAGGIQFVCNQNCVYADGIDDGLLAGNSLVNTGGNSGVLVNGTGNGSYKIWGNDITASAGTAVSVLGGKADITGTKGSGVTMLNCAAGFCFFHDNQNVQGAITYSSSSTGSYFDNVLVNTTQNQVTLNSPSLIAWNNSLPSDVNFSTLSNIFRLDSPIVVNSNYTPPSGDIASIGVNANAPAAPYGLNISGSGTSGQFAYMRFNKGLSMGVALGSQSLVISTDNTFGGPIASFGGSSITLYHPVTATQVNALGTTPYQANGVSGVSGTANIGACAFTFNGIITAGVGTSPVTCGYYQTVMNGSLAMTQRKNLKFTGSGVSVTDDGTDSTVVSISGGGGTSGGGVNVYTASQTLGAADSGKLVVMNCASACAVTLPSAQPSSNWYTQITSVGAGAAIVTLAGSQTFNGASTVPVLNKFRVLTVYADTTTSTNYQGDAPLVAGSNVTFTPASNGLTVAGTPTSFGAVTTATNTTATMTVGSGATLTTSGTGVLNANQINGGTMPVSQGCIGTDGSGKPINGTCTGGSGVGNFPTASVSGASLTFFSNCTTAGSPCVVPKGGGLFDLVSATNILTAPGTGTGTAYVYWSTSGPVIGTATGVSITGTGGGPLAIVSTQGSTDFYTVGLPVPTALIAKCDYGSGVWTSSSLKNYQPAAAPAAPVIAPGTGISIATNGQTQTASIDTGAASLGTGTANYVAKWNGNNYTLAPSVFYDDGTKAGAGGVPDTGYTFQANGTSTGTIYTGIANHDATNVGSASFCQVVNAAASATCISQVGSAAAGGPVWSVGGNGDFIFNSTVSSSEVFRIYNAGGFKISSRTPPTCDNTKGGMFAYQHTNGTTKDVVEVCAQDVSGVYAWRAIY